MSLETFRAALGSKLGEVLTPELAAWLETNCFLHQIGFLVPKGGVPGIDMRVKLDKLVHQIIAMPQVHCPIREFHAPGVYAREVTIPKGAVLVGAVHKTRNLAVLSKGCLRLVTGESTTDIEASSTPLTVSPGTMNAAYALEESVWTNYFSNPTNETDPRKLVEMFSELKFDELLGGSKNPQILVQAKLMELEA